MENTELRALQDAIRPFAQTPQAQVQLLLAFVAAQQLGPALTTYLNTLTPSAPTDPFAAFLADIARELDDMIPWAQEKAKRAQRHGHFDASLYYPSGAGGARTDASALKCFLHTLGAEIAAQYKPLGSNKHTQSLIRTFKGAM